MQSIASNVVTPDSDISRQPTICLLGDSLGDRNKWQDASTYYFIQDYGYWAFANQFLGHRLRLLNVAALAGAKINTIATFIPDGVVAYKPGYCLVFAGINDVNAFSTTGSTQGDTALYEDAWQRYCVNLVQPMFAADIIPILCTLPPLNSLGSVTSQRGWYYFNQKIRDFCASNRGVILADLASNTYADTLGYNAQSASMIDTVHPNALGCQQIGKAIAAAVSPFVPAQPRYAVVAGDYYNGVTPAAFRTANNAGTVGAGTPAPSGTAQTGWTLQGAFSGGVAGTESIVGSQVAATDGGNDWQQIVVAATGLSGARVGGVYFYSTANLLSGNTGFAPGDWIESAFEVVVSGTQTNVATIMARVLFQGSTHTELRSPLQVTNATSIGALATATMVGTPIARIPSTATSLRLGFYAQFTSTQATYDLTIKVRNPSIRKVTPIAPPAISFTAWE